MKTRKCRRCGFEKPLDDFSKNKDRGDGHQTWCKRCHRSYHRSWQRGIREGALNIDRETIPDPMQNLDNFFDGVGHVAAEIQALRKDVNNLMEALGEAHETVLILERERDNWKARATIWSEKLVELQNILSSPPRKN